MRLNSNDTDLKPCPFCGSSGGSSIDVCRVGKLMYVKCFGCGVRTELRISKQEAKAAWNRRESET